MTRRLAILCSGQGGQSGAMLALLQSDAQAWQHWQELEAHWRSTSWAAGLQAAAALHPHRPGPAGTLESSANLPSWADLLQQQARFQNRYAQALVVAFGLAAWAGLQPSPAVSLVAGYSVGEMTAHAVASALTPQQTMTLTQQRALLMDAAARTSQRALLMDSVARTPASAASAIASAGKADAANQVMSDGEQGLLAVSGTPWRLLAAMIAAAPAYVAIDNGAQSCVLGGSRRALDALAQQFARHSIAAQTIAVSVAAHTPLLQLAAAPFLACLQQANWQRPRSPVLAAVDARRVSRPEQACSSMAQALHATVHWSAAMDALAEGGIGVALELGPGSALARMLQQRHPQISCRALADFRSLPAAREWLARQVAEDAT